MLFTSDALAQDEVISIANQNLLIIEDLSNDKLDSLISNDKNQLDTLNNPQAKVKTFIRLGISYLEKQKIWKIS